MDIIKFNKLVGVKAQEFIESGLPTEALFPFLIREMNAMYEQPVNTDPTLDVDEVGEKPSVRIAKFLKTLQKEIEEGLEVQAQLEYLEAYAQQAEPDEFDEDERLNDLDGGHVS